MNSYKLKKCFQTLSMYLQLIILFFIQFLRMSQILVANRSHNFVAIGNIYVLRDAKIIHDIYFEYSACRSQQFFSIKIQLSFSFSLVEVFFSFVRGKVKPRSVCVHTHAISIHIPKNLQESDEIVLVPVAFPQIFFSTLVNLVATCEVKYKSSGKRIKKKKHS